MKGVGAIVSYYIDSSLHVGLAVTSLVHVSALSIAIAFPFSVYASAFLATVLGYNTIKYGWKRNRKGLFVPGRFPVVTLMALVGLLGSTYKLSLLQLGVFLAIGIMVMFYTFPVQKGGLNLRNQRKIKIYWVALVWALFTVVFPFPEQMFEEFSGFGLLIHRFVFVFCATLPFEIRDFPTDSPLLRTWPQRFGITTTRRVGMALVISAATVIFFLEVEPTIVTLLTHFSLALAIGLAKANQSQYYASFWVESIPILWAVTFYL